MRLPSLSEPPVLYMLPIICACPLYLLMATSPGPNKQPSNLACNPRCVAVVAHTKAIYKPPSLCMLLSICDCPLYLNRLCYTCYPLYAPVPFIPLSTSEPPVLYMLPIICACPLYLLLNRLCYTCYPLYAPVPFISFLCSSWAFFINVPVLAANIFDLRTGTTCGPS